MRASCPRRSPKARPMHYVATCFTMFQQIAPRSNIFQYAGTRAAPAHLREQCPRRSPRARPPAKQSCAAPADHGALKHTHARRRTRKHARTRTNAHEIYTHASRTHMHTNTRAPVPTDPFHCGATCVHRMRRSTSFRHERMRHYITGRNEHEYSAYSIGPHTAPEYTDGPTAHQR
jgi:hypothetical protein